MDTEKKDSKVKYGTVFTCCMQDFEERSEFITHLESAHGIKITEQIFTKSILMHMDGQDWFSSSYSYSCDAVTFTEFTRLKREKNDPMRGW